MTRKAQYGDTDTRIISVASTDQWCVQKRGPGESSRTHDPWVQYTKPLPYHLAKAAAGIK